MTKEELTGQLNGREVGYEIDGGQEAQAKASGLVVVFGASDDLLEFRGAVDDEMGAYEGAIIYFTSTGLLMNECDNEDCPYFEEIRKATKDTVTAIWEKDGYSWVIESTMPFAPFDILEDGKKYCRGIVLELPEVKS